MGGARTVDVRARVAVGAAYAAQGFGYALASLGPFGFGLAHEISGGWALPTLLFAGVALGAALCGLGAGRNLHVGQAPRGP